MFGGGNSNPLLPVLLEQNRFQYDTNGFPQLQLFGDFPAGCSVDPSNYIRNEQTSLMNRSIKRGREEESFSRQQRLQISLNNNFCQDEHRQPGSMLNRNLVSTGLKLSYEEDEHNSSVTSLNENLAASVPVISSFRDNLKTEVDRQKEELDNYIRIKEEDMMKGVRELTHRQTTNFLAAMEQQVSKKLHEKEVEIENMNRKNKELVERIKQVSSEAQAWQQKAKYNESVVNILKNNLKQVMSQGNMQGKKEGYGDSEADDASSYAVGGSSNHTTNQMICRACKVKEVSVLLLPCRHLCLCLDCAGIINICPVCKVAKTAGVQVFLSS